MEQNLITNEEAFTILYNIPTDRWNYFLENKKINSSIEFESDETKRSKDKVRLGHPYLYLTLEQIIEGKFLDRKSKFFKREKIPNPLTQEIITYLLDITHWAKRGLNDYTQLAKIKIIPEDNHFNYINNLYNNVVKTHQEHKIKKEEVLRQNAINQTKSYISKLKEDNKNDHCRI